MKTLSRVIGFAIRERRLALGLSALELSEVCGVSPRTIVEIEWHMLDDIDILTIEALCDGLSIDLPALLDRAFRAKLGAVQL